jgi:hypothetical protein
MSEFRDTLKKNLPEPVVGALRDGKNMLQIASEWPQVNFHPWRRDTIHRLERLKDTHKGERCFILGNGPSLRKTDLSRLRNEYTIGMNRFYLAFPEIGFKTSFYVSVNDLVVEQWTQDIQTMDMPCFVSWRARKWLTPQENLFFLYTTYNRPKFARDITGRLWEGATVTYASLQVAYYLGFSQVILIGVDHNFATTGKANATVTSQGDDPNHFHPGYFGKGVRWQLPDLETNEIAYHMARQAYEADGRSVIDATIDGKLRIFPKVEYDSLFQ